MFTDIPGISLLVSAAITATGMTRSRIRTINFAKLMITCYLFPKYFLSNLIMRGGGLGVFESEQMG